MGRDWLPEQDRVVSSVSSFYRSRQYRLPSPGWIQTMALLDRLDAMALAAAENQLGLVQSALVETRAALLVDVCDIGGSLDEDFNVSRPTTAHKVFEMDDDFNYLDLLYDMKLPFYLTDPHGVVQMYSPAAESFWGWSPRIGEQRWCGSWQLATEDGNPLPFDECPMADCVRTQTAIRGKHAVTIRPDGTRRRFAPLPTPVRGQDGRMVAALNVLIEMPAPDAL